MELKEFITQTLNDTVDGVIEAQQHAIDKKAMINPLQIPSSSSKTHFPKDVNSGRNYIQTIEFDIAVTAIGEDKARGGIGVFSAVLNVGAQGESNTTNSEISRIKFSIPVLFPSQQ